MDVTLVSKISHDSTQLCIVAHPSEHSVACAGMDGVITLWQARESDNEASFSLQKVASATPYKSSCRSVRFWSVSSSFLPSLCLVSASSKGTIIIHDAGTLESKLRVTKAHEAGIGCVCPLNQTRLATGDEDGRLRIWRVDEDGQQLLVVHEFDLGEHVIDMCVARRFLLVTAGDCSLKAYDFRKGKLYVESEQLDSELTSISLLNVHRDDGETGNDSKLPKRRLGTKQERLKARAKEERLKAKLNAHALVVCSAENGMLNVFRFGEFGNVLTRYELCDEVSVHSSCALSNIVPNRLVFGCEDGVIRVVECDALDFRTLKVKVVADTTLQQVESVGKRKKNEVKSELWAVAASYDGAYLFVADGDSQVIAYRVERHEQQQTSSDVANANADESVSTTARASSKKRSKKSKQDNHEDTPANNFFAGLLSQ